MKYGIVQRLDPDAADLAQRFHVALIQRLYERQQGAAPDWSDPVDVAIAAMDQWGGAAAASASLAQWHRWRRECVMGPNPFD